MTTFVLNKYSNKDQPNTADTGTTEPKQSDTSSPSDQDNKEVTITVTGTVSQIVATALHEVFANKDINVYQQEKEPSDSNIKVISTEDINKDPIETFNSIKENDMVFIHAPRMFTTAKEEWFLTNINNKTSNVHYTIESFMRRIIEKLN